MSQLGLGVMISHLRGSDVDMSTYLEKTIVQAELVDNALCLQFEDGRTIKIFDDGQSCCEHRYMRTDDQVSDLVGRKLRSLELKKAPNVPYPQSEEEDDYYYDTGECHEVQFLEVGTDMNSVVFSNHNEHNGYYGGFALRVEEVE